MSTQCGDAGISRFQGGLGISFILSVHNWCMQLPHGASLQARTNHAIMTGQVHSSCDANLGTSMIDLGLPRSKIQKSVENTAFHRTSTNCHPPRLPPGPFERPRQDAIFVAATFSGRGLYPVNSPKDWFRFWKSVPGAGI